MAGMGGKPAELEALFLAHYARVARLIARVIRNPGRAEELAVEVFLKYSRNRLAPGATAEGWLSLTAARMALDELRSAGRRARMAPLLRMAGWAATPEEIHGANEEQNRVRTVLARLSPRDAELLLLRSDGMRYEDMAATLELHAASVGKMLARAQKAFRKEYVERYGKQ